MLRDCLLLKPGSCVEDVYDVLKKPPYRLLEGDFVRAECVAISGCSSGGTSGSAGGSAAAAGGGAVVRRVARKDEALAFDNCVLKVMTNRKASWQQKR